jgi:alpha-tubulin suppressor-like RCC1 family protein
MARSSARVVRRAFALAAFALALGTGCAFLIGLEEHELAHVADDAAPGPGDAGPCCPSEDSGYTCLEGGICGNRVVQIAPGFTLSCVLLAAGEVWCWGDNQFMELGFDPASTAETCGEHHCSTRPRKIGVHDITEIAVGAAHACALARDASVWCWGLSVFGQSGQDPFDDAGTRCRDVPSKNANPAACTKPARVAFPPETRIVHITAGVSANCALSESKEVYCWGFNPFGVSGQPPPTPAGGGVPGFYQPRKVEGISNARDVACGGDVNCCSIVDNDELRCWGGNRAGQLGIASPEAGTEKPQPILADASGVAFGGVAQVATPAESIVALRKDGTLWAWGSNYVGVLANGRAGSGENFPHPYPLALGLPESTRMSASTATFFAVGKDGIVRSWGLNTTGQTANGKMNGTACGLEGELRCLLTPTDVPALAGAVRVEGKAYQGMALQSDGGVFVWGDNSFGQLGHSPGAEGDVPCLGGLEETITSCQPVPKPMPGLP